MGVIESKLRELIAVMKCTKISYQDQYELFFTSEFERIISRKPQLQKYRISSTTIYSCTLPSKVDNMLKHIQDLTGAGTHENRKPLTSNVR